MTPITIKTFPRVTLRPEARVALRDFAHRHKARVDAGRLEGMAARQAIEFCLVHGAAPWFDAWPAHPFMALELAPDRKAQAVDQLELVVITRGLKQASRCEVTTLDAHSIPGDYHVQRVIHESRLIKV